MQVFNKKYCLIKKKYYICVTKLITHLKTNKMKLFKTVLKVLTILSITFLITIVLVDIINNGSKML